MTPSGARSLDETQQINYHRPTHAATIQATLTDQTPHSLTAITDAPSGDPTTTATPGPFAHLGSVTGASRRGSGSAGGSRGRSGGSSPPGGHRPRFFGRGSSGNVGRAAG